LLLLLLLLQMVISCKTRAASEDTTRARLRWYRYPFFRCSAAIYKC